MSAGRAAVSPRPVTTQPPSPDLTSIDRATDLLAWGRTRRGVDALFEALDEGHAIHEPLCEALCILGRRDEAWAVTQGAPGTLGPLLRRYLELDARTWGLQPDPSTPSHTLPSDGSSYGLWVRGLEALVAGDATTMARRFEVAVGRQPDGWHRASMLLCLALHALEQGRHQEAQRWTRAHLDHFDISMPLHPGRVRADRHLLLLWQHLAGNGPVDHQRLRSLDHEAEQLLDRGMRTTSAELSVLRCAQRALAATPPRHHSVLEALEVALTADTEGCLVKRAYVQPQHLQRVRRALSTPEQG